MFGTDSFHGWRRRRSSLVRPTIPASMPDAKAGKVREGRVMDGWMDGWMFQHSWSPERRLTVSSFRAFPDKCFFLTFDSQEHAKQVCGHFFFNLALIFVKFGKLLKMLQFSNKLNTN